MLQSRLTIKNVLFEHLTSCSAVGIQNVDDSVFTLYIILHIDIVTFSVLLTFQNQISVSSSRQVLIENLKMKNGCCQIYVPKSLTCNTKYLISYLLRILLFRVNKKKAIFKKKLFSFRV